MADQRGNVQLLRRLGINYLALGQFELARAIFQELKRLDGSSPSHILQAVAEQSMSQRGWLASAAVPSQAHMAWLSECELAPAAGAQADPRRSAIQHALLLVAAASLQDKDLSVKERNGSNRGGGAVKAGNQMVGRLHQGAVGFKDDMMQADSDQIMLLPSKESLTWLLRTEPQLFRSLVEKRSSAPMSQLLVQQWQKALGKADVQGICHTLAQIVSEGDAETLKDNGVLFDHTLTLLPPQEKPSNNERSLLWGAAAANGIKSVSVLLQESQDALIASTARAAASETALSPPLAQLQTSLHAAKDGGDVRPAAQACVAALFHHARVTRTHVLEMVLQEALMAAQEQDVQKAADILVPFPELAPLVTVMAWDLHTGQVAPRQDLLQRLWHQRARPLHQEHHQESAIKAWNDKLSYRLHVANQIALSSSKTEGSQAHDFATNLFLERLEAESLIRVLTNPPMPVRPEVAIQLVGQQPVGDTKDEVEARQHDSELLRVHLSLQAYLRAWEHAVALEALQSEGALREAGQHMKRVASSWKKAWLVDTLASLLQLRPPTTALLPYSAIGEPRGQEQIGEVRPTAPLIAAHFVSLLQHHLPQPNSFLPRGSLDGRPVEQKSSPVRRVWTRKVVQLHTQFRDWHWRLHLLHQLAEGQGKPPDWGDAVASLQASPTQLLERCIRAGHMELASQMATRFSLAAQERAPLELAACLDQMAGSLKGGSSARDGSKDVLDLEPDFSGLEHKLSPLTMLVVCLDMALTAAPSAASVTRVLAQAKSSAQMCQAQRAWVIPGGETEAVEADRKGMLRSSHKGQKDRPLGMADELTKAHMAAVFDVADSLVQQLQEWQAQDPSVPLPALLAHTFHNSPNAPAVGPDLRAVTALQAAIQDAHDGKRQFLSGKLHNLVKALASSDDFGEPQALARSKAGKPTSPHGPSSLLGFGLTASSGLPEAPLSAGVSIRLGSWGSGLDGEAGAPTSPLAQSALLDTGGKRASLLSAFVHYVASIGDIMDEVDTTHTYDFFSILYHTPNQLLTQLAFERGSTDSAARAAELMGADLTRQLLASSLPPVLPPAHASTSKPEEPRRTLQVEVARSVVQWSPQQAVLAAHFGGRPRKGQGDPNKAAAEEAGTQDLRRLALDVAKRFPHLHRWLLLHEGLPPAPGTPPLATPPPATAPSTPRRSFKRLRPSKEDCSTAEEARVAAQNIASGGHNSISIQERSSELAGHTNGLVEWEDESVYTERVTDLTRRGALQDALDLADSRLAAGAPDALLLEVIEQEGRQGGERGQARERGPSRRVESWQGCMRLRDKETAGHTALRHLRRWACGEGEQVLNHCAAHLAADSPLRHEVLQRRAQLQRYTRALEADPTLNTWQQVEDAFLSDPEGLALRLSSKGAVAAALEVVYAAGLRSSLRQELQSRQLVDILRGKPTQGAGPAAALRYLQQLPTAGEAMGVVTQALPLLGHVRDKRMLVRHLLAHPPSPLSEPDTNHLRSLAVGLEAVATLPLPWQARCGHLVEHPQLVLESLLMAQQFKTAHKMLAASPSLHNDALILRYAAKALAPPIAAEPPSDSRALHPSLKSPASNAPFHRLAPPEASRTASMVVPRAKGERPSGVTVRSASTANSVRGVGPSPEGPSTPRRLSWAAGTSNMWAAASQFTRGLLHQGGDGSDSLPPAPAGTPQAEQAPALPPNQSAAWEAMSGPADARGVAVHEAVPKGRIAGDAGLTGDPNKDDMTRRSHHFEGAPSAAMLKAILPLCADIPNAIPTVLSTLEKHMGSAFAGPASSPALQEQALRVTDAWVEALQYLRELGSKIGHKELGEAVLMQVQPLLASLEVVQALLRAGVPIEQPELQQDQGRISLCDRLLHDHRFPLAHKLCSKAGVALDPVEMAWGMALLAMGHYQQARPHLRAALALLSESGRQAAVQTIVHSLEVGPPVNLQQTRSLYSEMARSVALSSEEAFSFDAYLNVLNAVPEQRPPVSRRSSGEQSDEGMGRGVWGMEDSRTDYLRVQAKEEALVYMQQYQRAGVLPFLFRHSHFGEACRTFLSSLSPLATSTPLPPLPPAGPSQKGTGALGEAFVSEYGSLEEFCELCVTYGAMPVLEQALEEASVRGGPEWAAMCSAVLVKMAAFCEAHRHFHHLYRIQVFQKDHVAAGLTCIQLFHNATSADEAVKHLEAARDHFDEGLSARQLAHSESGAPGKRIKDVRKSASAKLSEEEIVKFSTRVALQAEIVRAFGDSEAHPWQHSLFGNPSDAETVRRRTQVAEQLAERNFDLAFRVIYDFNLPVVATYAGASAGLAMRRRSSGVSELVRNITGTIDDAERDQVLMAAINVYATHHKEHPASLVDQLSNSHRKVLACVASGRLKSAFQFASRADNLADVQLVAHQARETGQLNVMDLCHQWLGRKMEPGADAK